MRKERRNTVQDPSLGGEVNAEETICIFEALLIIIQTK